MCTKNISKFIEFEGKKPLTFNFTSYKQLIKVLENEGLIKGEKNLAYEKFNSTYQILYYKKEVVGFVTDFDLAPYIKKEFKDRFKKRFTH